MARQSILTAIAILALFSGLSGHALTQSEEDNETRRADMLAQMQAKAAKTQVEYVREAEPLKLADKPVFRYDDQPRRLLDATVWVWLDAGRPVAFQKIEAMGSDVPQWQSCFSSFAEEPLQAQWENQRKYRSKAAGVTYLKVSEGPEVADRETERRRQVRELARAFSARTMLNARGTDSQEMRLLSTPLLEYEDEETKLLEGAVFGYSTNGTNPDLLIGFEVRKQKEQLAWHYAVARMTTSGIAVKHRDRLAWECSFVAPGENEFET